MKKSLLSLAIAAIAAGLLSSCVNELEVPKTEKELNEFINSQFDYNTWKKVSVRMEMDTRALIPVYTYDPTTTTEAEPIFSVVTDRNGRFNGRIELGSAMMGKDLYAVCNGTVIKARVDKNGVVFKNTAASRADGIPDGIQDICDQLDQSFHAQLPAGNNNTKKVSQRMTDIEIHVKQSYTTVAVSWLDYGDQFPLKAYYYYYDDGGIDEATGKYRKTLKDEFPTPQDFYNKFIDSQEYTYGHKKSYHITPASVNSETGEIEDRYVDRGYNSHRGTTIVLRDLDEDHAGGLPYFSGRTAIGFVVLVNISGTEYLLFPNDIGAICTNNLSSWDNVSKLKFHAGAYRNDDNSNLSGVNWPAELTPSIDGVDPSDLGERTFYPVVYGFEDNCTSGSDKDYDDLMFIAFVNGGMDRNIPGSLEQVITHKGTYLFEDLYPTPGDYDMNDVVVDYEYTAYYETKGEGDDRQDIVTGFNWYITPRWDGATYINDFCLAYTTNDGTVSRKDVYKNNRSALANKTSYSGYAWMDDEGNKHGCEFAQGLLGRPADENLFRFTYGSSPVLNYGINPYIFCKNTNHQVHLPKFKFDYLGEGEPVNDAALGVYVINDYNGGTGYPFAMDLSRDNKEHGWSFDIVTESKHIYKEYSKFSNWVINHESTDDYNDWYDHKDK